MWVNMLSSALDMLSVRCKCPIGRQKYGSGLYGEDLSCRYNLKSHQYIVIPISLTTNYNFLIPYTSATPDHSHVPHTHTPETSLLFFLYLYGSSTKNFLSPWVFTCQNSTHPSRFISSVAFSMKLYKILLIIINYFQVFSLYLKSYLFPSLKYLSLEDAYLSFHLFLSHYPKRVDEQ